MRELVSRVVVLSAEARTVDKIYALAAAASGLTADATDLMLAHLALDAIRSLDESQINVLRIVATPLSDSPQVGGFTTQSIGSWSALDRKLVDPVLALLVGQRLITRQEPPTGTVWGGGAPALRARYDISPLGKPINDLLSVRDSSNAPLALLPKRWASELVTQTFTKAPNGRRSLATGLCVSIIQFHPVRNTDRHAIR
jgi:hypothetical protein